jgi:hypothetical protein
MRSSAMLLALLALLTAAAVPISAGTLPAATLAHLRSALPAAASAPAAAARSGTLTPRYYGTPGSGSGGSGGYPPPAPAGGHGAGLSPEQQQDCRDAFLAWLETSSSCYGSAAQCCEPFLELGEACWSHILEAVSADEAVLKET